MVEIEHFIDTNSLSGRQGRDSDFGYNIQTIVKGETERERCNKVYSVEDSALTPDQVLLQIERRKLALISLGEKVGAQIDGLVSQRVESITVLLDKAVANSPQRQTIFSKLLGRFGNHEKK